MKRTEDKNTYIKARAEGHSIRKASEIAGINRGTGYKWEKSLYSLIAEERAEVMEDLKNKYSMTKAGRLEAVGKLLERLQSAVDGIEIDKMPSDKVISLYLRTLKEASREAVPIGSGETDPTHFEDLISELLIRVTSGELLPDQAYAETRAVIAAAHIHETTTLQKKVEELANVLDTVKTKMETMKKTE